MDRGEEEEEREGVKSESWKKTAVKAELSQSGKCIYMYMYTFPTTCSMFMLHLV